MEPIYDLLKQRLSNKILMHLQKLVPFIGLNPLTILPYHKIYSTLRAFLTAIPHYRISLSEYMILHEESKPFIAIHQIQVGKSS